MTYIKPYTQQLQEAIEYHKIGGSDYDALDYDDQRKIIGLYAQTMKDLDDLLCDIKNKQAAGYLVTGDILALGEYIETEMVKYLEPQVREHYNETYIEGEKVYDENQLNLRLHNRTEARGINRDNEIFSGT